MISEITHRKRMEKAVRKMCKGKKIFVWLSEEGAIKKVEETEEWNADIVLQGGLPGLEYFSGEDQYKNTYKDYVWAFNYNLLQEKISKWLEKNKYKRI